MAKLRSALLFMDGNFVGREYYARLVEAGREPDLVVTVGVISEASTAWEIRRTGGKWNPPPLPDGKVVRRFAKMADPELWDFIAAERIDVCIQGGIGILKSHMIAAPRIGFINVHPGRLPQYRGNSCPEWALYNNDPIWATAHLIDEGIDTGPVIAAQPMSLAPGWSYTDIRANIYAHCARVLISALEKLEAWDGRDLSAVAQAQTETGAHYWPQIPPEKLAELQDRLQQQAVRASATGA